MHACQAAIFGGGFEALASAIVCPSRGGCSETPNRARLAPAWATARPDLTQPTTFAGSPEAAGTLRTPPFLAVDLNERQRAPPKPVSGSPGTKRAE